MKELGDTELRILEAAEALFAEKGFDATSIRDICSEAGANIAAVHYHFGDKEQLYIATVKRAHSCSVGADNFAMRVDANLPPVEKLRQFIYGMACQLHAPAQPTAMKLLMREMAAPGKAAHVVVQEFIQPMAFYLRSIIRELLPGCPAPQSLMIGFSIIGQILFYRQNRPVTELIFGKAEVEALTATMVAEHITRFSLAALGLDAPLPADTRQERAGEQSCIG